MRKSLIMVLLCHCAYSNFAQNRAAVSRNILFQDAKEDRIRALLIYQLSRACLTSKPDTALLVAKKYLRLNYHGLPSKDKHFNADVKIDFDKSIDKINIVLQDMGRVLLNLFNNAFYAVNEKANASLRQAQSKLSSAGHTYGYQPTAKVSARRSNNAIDIRVEDNGNCIPQKIIDKILQPFFTAKPKGQGTGLGLSLAYDIIKADNGKIEVETKDDAGSTFIIKLPTNNIS